MQIALFTMALGKDRIYFDSAARYFPYNKKYFGQNNNVDYYLFTDREEVINDEIIHVPSTTNVWPYTTLLKNNMFKDYFDKASNWDKYDYVFFIDADFAIGDYYDFFSHEFVMAKTFWNNKYCGGFYGGKTKHFKKLCSLVYDEMNFLFENKLPVPRDLDEFYLTMFKNKFTDIIHIIKMVENDNVLMFVDDEDLNKAIEKYGNKLFLMPYKSKGRANKTMLRSAEGKEIECILNLDELYIFNNFTYEFGRLLPVDKNNFQIFWSKKPEVREFLNLENKRISKRIIKEKENYPSPLISIVMPVYNEKIQYLNDSINSILNQTFSDFELLIINDGSTEVEGINYIKSYNDPRIRLINNEHDFISTLNRGVKEARGKYLVRMDADDIMKPHRLECQYYYMEDNPEIDICGSWFELFGNRKGEINVKSKHEEIVSNLLTHNTIAHPTIIMRDTVFKKIEPLYEYNYPTAEDYRLWTVLAIKGYRFANIPEVLLRYRSSEKQATYVKYHEMTKSSSNIQREFVEEVAEMLIDKKPEFFPILESAFDLQNEDVIKFKTVQQITFHLYIAYLESQNSRH